MRGKFRTAGILVMILTLVFTLAGCNGSNDTPDATPEDAAADTQQVYELRLSHHNSPQADVSIQYEEWAKLVGEKTQGRVKVTVYPGETLGKMMDAVTNIEQGIVDIAWVNVPNFGGRFPVTEVIALPMLGINTSKEGAKVLWDLYNVNADMQKEYANFKVIGFTISASQFISTSNKKVTKVEDLKGLNLRVANWGGSELLKLVGASPVSMSPPDMYEGLSKGVIDGIVFDYAGIQSFKLDEVTNYANTTPIVMNPHAILMNKAKWESLPPDLQKIIDDECGGEVLGEIIAKGFDIDISDKYKVEGKEVYSFSPEEAKKLEDIANPVWDKWISDNKGKIDSQLAFDQVMEIIAKDTTK